MNIAFSLFVFVQQGDNRIVYLTCRGSIFYDVAWNGSSVYLALKKTHNLSVIELKHTCDLTKRVYSNTVRHFKVQ